MLIQHFLGVAMVRSHEEDVVVLLAGIEDFADRFVGGFTAFDGGFVDACVADHVGWGEVVHEEVVLAGFDPFAELVCHAGGAHFWVKVVCFHFGGWDQVAVFVLELLFDAAVEEEGDVCVLFGFGNVTLAAVFRGDVFCENISHALRGESNGEGVFGVVACHGGQGDVFRVREGWQR